MSLDARHKLYMSCAHHDTPESASAEGDPLVHDAVQLEAAAHVADRHAIGIDHAGPFEAGPRLVDLAQADQSTLLAHVARRTDHMVCCQRSTSMELENVSVVDSSRKIYLSPRRDRAVNARAADASASAMDGRNLVLRRVHIPLGPAPFNLTCTVRFKSVRAGHCTH